MPELLEVHHEGDIIYTLPLTGTQRGALRAWRINSEGVPVEVHPVTKVEGERL